MSSAGAGAHGEGTGGLRIRAGRPWARRLSLAATVGLVGYALLVVLYTPGDLGRLAFVALLAVGNLPVAIQNLGVVEVEGDRLVVDARVRRHEARWADLAAVRLHLHPFTVPARAPLLEHRDGTTHRSAVLAQLSRASRIDERNRLLARLERESQRWGFDLDVRLPEWQEDDA